MPHTPLLLETIKIEHGKIFNLPYHQKRLDKSQYALFGMTNTSQLSTCLTSIPQKGCYRCRIVYDTEIRSVEYLPYTPKTIHSLKVVPSTILYPYKYLCRDNLNALLSQHKETDEIIIEKEGLLTDTTISNIALYDGKRWLTPQTPLLEGTMRAKLLEKGFLKPEALTKEALSHATHVALINAMIGFKILNHVKITI